MKNKFKKISTAAVLLISTVAAITLASCGTSLSANTTLELWAGGQWTGHDAENLQVFIDAYNADESHTVKVNLTLKSEFETQFASSLQVGRQPDLVVWDRFNTPTYAAQDFLYPINNLIARDNIDTSIFQEQAYDELSYDGNQYGLPLDLDIWGIYVNNDLLDAYNEANPDNQAVIPATWDELLDTAKKLTVSSGGKITQAGYSSQDMYEHYFKFMVSTGDNFLGEDGYPNYFQDSTRETIDFFKDVVNANVSSLATSSKDAFKSGKLVMINQPVYYSSYLKTYAPNLNYTFIPQPAMSSNNGVQGGMIGGFGFALPKALAIYQTNSYWEKQELAWNFMKDWLTNEDMQLEWSKVSNTLPALKSVYDSEWVQSTQVLKSAAEYSEFYQCRPSVPGFYYIQVNVYNNYIKQYINGGNITMDDLIQTLDTQSRKIIDAYN